MIDVRARPRNAVNCVLTSLGAKSLVVPLVQTALSVLLGRPWHVP